MLIPSVHSLCSISVLHGQYCESFRWQLSNCASPVFLKQSLHSCCVHICTWSAGLTDAIVSMDVRSSIFELSATFCGIQALIKESQCTSITWWWISMGEKYFARKSHNRGFYIGPSYECHYLCTSNYPVSSIWLTDSCAIYLMVLYFKWYRLSKSNMFN